MSELLMMSEEPLATISITELQNCAFQYEKCGCFPFIFLCPNETCEKACSWENPACPDWLMLQAGFALQLHTILCECIICLIMSVNICSFGGRKSSNTSGPHF
jgi:hypothetical protein